MSCRRASFSVSCPGTGRSRSSSTGISKGWRSGSRSKSRADGAPHHNPGVRVGARVSLCWRTFVRASSMAGLMLALGTHRPAAAAPQAPVAEPPDAAQPSPTPQPTPAPEPSPPPKPAPSPAPTPSASSGEEEAPRRGGAGTPFTLETEGGGEKRVIGSIIVDGNIRVSDSAFTNSLKIKPGDPYDEATIREEFRRLWDMDLFDDITVESRQRSPGVYDLIFHVRDRPLISNVSFVG